MGLCRCIPSRHIRLLIYKAKGAIIDKRVSIFRTVDIRNPKGLVIKKGSSIGPRVLLDARKGLIIGENVTVAYEAIIWSLHHELQSPDFHTKGATTKIGDYSWICS